jgi:spore cortex formation protein SpoVR/YcgB (stage V sporulation)
MTIKLTHKRKIKLNDYKRLMVESGLLLWYIHLNFGKITLIRERLYTNDKDDVVYESVIKELPGNVNLAVQDFINNL